MTELPKLGLVAVLQRRGEFNHEKLEKILKGEDQDEFGESFPGGCNLTVWGGMKENETPVDLAKFDKNIGIMDRSVIALYGDCKQAIKNAFAIFKSPTN